MELTVEELLQCTENPKINEISLELLRVYYEKYLVPFQFQYNIIHPETNEEHTITLCFDRENFCHLLGIESIVRKSVRHTRNYKGMNGWNSISKGNIHFKDLKLKNKVGFNNNKARFVFFYLLPQLVLEPKALLFKPHLVSNNTYIECEILFYDQIKRAYVHLGITRSTSSSYYVPRTFLIEKITDTSSGEKYIENQKHFEVNSVIQLNRV